MKKLLFTLFIAIALTACGSKVYNTQLKQVELRMTQQELVTLMGNDYTILQQQDAYNQTIMYKDRYNNEWVFDFADGQLVRWYNATKQ